MNSVERAPDQLIRNAKHTHDVRLLAADASAQQIGAARKALRDVHRLETMAVQIYRAQWTSRPTELNRQLIAAMENELTHQTDSLGRLMEFGGRPTILRLPYYMVGWTMGRMSRLMGFRAMMRTGAWAEAKAIVHYEHLSAACQWHPETYQMLLRIWDDERIHHQRWLWFLEHPDEAMGPPQPRAADGAPTTP